jgi:hypothetical protein
MHAPIPWTAPYPNAPGKYCAWTIGTAAGPPPQPSSSSSSSNSRSSSPDMTGHVFWHCHPRTLPQLRWGPQLSWTPWTDRPSRPAALPGRWAFGSPPLCLPFSSGRLCRAPAGPAATPIPCFSPLFPLPLSPASRLALLCPRPLPACAPLSAPPCHGKNLNTRSGHAPSSNEVVARHLSMNTSTSIQ